MDFRRFLGRFSSSRVQVYADFIDPFSYIGFHNLSHAAARGGVQLEWCGFEFNPDTPADGYHLLTQQNSDARAGMWASVQAFASRSGVLLKEPQWACRTARVQQLANALPAGPETTRFLLDCFSAYFNRGLNLEEPQVLTRLLSAFPSLAFRGRSLLDSNNSQRSTNREAAKKRGFPGLPGFVFKGKNYFGALSADAWSAIFSHDHEQKEILCSIR